VTCIAFNAFIILMHPLESNPGVLGLGCMKKKKSYFKTLEYACM